MLDDITHQQLLDAINGIGESVVSIVDLMATKEDLNSLGTKLTAKIDTSEARLSRKIASVNQSSFAQHLESRAAIGALTSSIATIQDGLKKLRGQHKHSRDTVLCSYDNA